MSEIKITLAGVKSSKTYVKYAAIGIAPSGITFIMGNTVVGTMKMPDIDFMRGDTLTLSGIKGKLKAEMT